LERRQGGDDLAGHVARQFGGSLREGDRGQHTPSQKNISLNYWLKHGGRDVHVWIYSPNP
jgi:hypothetical protein